MSKAHELYVQMLIDKVREDRFPSGELMDRIESQLTTSDQAQEYFGLLMEKVTDSRYPSKQMLDRIERLSPPVR
jgi:hypothetical protein